MKLPNAIKLMIVEILAMKRDVLVRILTTCSDVQRVHALAKTKGATSCQIAKVHFFSLLIVLFMLSSFQERYTKLDSFLPINQYSQK